jgi:4-aminobutyrate aminotransferase
LDVDSADLIERHGRVISRATRLAFYPLVVAGGEGAIVRSSDGREWIDFLASAATLNTGIGHPAVVEAIREQAGRLPHYNAAYVYHQPMVELAEALVARTPGTFDKRVAFGLSGGDSVDGAIKAARKWSGRQKIIGFSGSYHGTTYGALTLSSVNLDMRRGLGPFLPEVYHVPYPDHYHDRSRRKPDEVGAAALAALDQLLSSEVPPEEVAAIILEPIQGDSGIVIPPQSFMTGLKERCERYGILFIVDEIQAGFGRTGRWFSIEHFGIEPDGVICGKAISSGIPLSAFVARSEILESWQAPAHTFSSGANPLSCAAALATIRVIEAEGLVERARTLGERLRKSIAELATRRHLIGDIRGEGLMIGVELVTSRSERTPAPQATAKVAWRCWELGLLVTFLRGNVLRLVPPLVITTEQIDRAVSILDRALDDVAQGLVPDEAVAQLKGW